MSLSISVEPRIRARLADPHVVEPARSRQTRAPRRAWRARLAVDAKLIRRQRGRVRCLAHRLHHDAIVVIVRWPGRRAAVAALQIGAQPSIVEDRQSAPPRPTPGADGCPAVNRLPIPSVCVPSQRDQVDVRIDTPAARPAAPPARPRSGPARCGDIGAAGSAGRLARSAGNGRCRSSGLERRRPDCRRGIISARCPASAASMHSSPAPARPAHCTSALLCLRQQRSPPPRAVELARPAGSGPAPRPA